MIREGLAVLPQAVLYATQSKWLHSHRLAAIDIVGTEGASQIHEADWWNERLSAVARTLSELPIVETTKGRLVPAVIGRTVGSTSTRTLCSHAFR